jgi:signal transduction histidine kinase
VICYVRDNGPGIDSRYHEKIFGLFEQLDPQKEGTGIGLAIVKRIIDVHGGRIWVESEETGKGAMFCFTIPVEERSTLSMSNEYKNPKKETWNHE